MNNFILEKVVCPDCSREFAKTAHLKTHRRRSTKCTASTSSTTSTTVETVVLSDDQEEDDKLSSERIIEDEDHEEKENVGPTIIKGSPSDATLNMNSQEFDTLSNIVKVDLQQDGIDVSMTEVDEDDNVTAMDDSKVEEAMKATTTVEEQVTKKNDTDEEGKDDVDMGQHTHTMDYADGGGRALYLSPLRRSLSTSNIVTPPPLKETVMPYSTQPASDAYEVSSNGTSSSIKDDVANQQQVNLIAANSDTFSGATVANGSSSISGNTQEGSSQHPTDEVPNDDVPNDDAVACNITTTETTALAVSEELSLSTSANNTVSATAEAQDLKMEQEATTSTPNNEKSGSTDKQAADTTANDTNTTTTEKAAKTAIVDNTFGPSPEAVNKNETTISNSSQPINGIIVDQTTTNIDTNSDKSDKEDISDMNTSTAKELINNNTTGAAVGSNDDEKCTATTTTADEFSTGGHKDITTSTTMVDDDLNDHDMCIATTDEAVATFASHMVAIGTNGSAASSRNVSNNDK